MTFYPSLLLLLLFLNMLSIWGFYAACQVDFVNDNPNKVDEDSKMIFWRLKVWTVKHLGWFWGKPVCLCPTCMSSLHSTYWYILFLSIVKFDTNAILFYPLYVLTLAGMNYLIGIVVGALKDE